jgi:hypothetical protein
MFDGMSLQEFNLIVEAKRQAYINEEISQTEMKEFLARNGYTASSIAEEMHDLNEQWLVIWRQKIKAKNI